jgi:hypothetical protein
LHKSIENADYPRVVSTDPWPSVSETTLEMMLQTAFDIVNVALEKIAIKGKPLVMIAG